MRNEDPKSNGTPNMAISRPSGVSLNWDRINVATFANRGTAVTSRCFKSFISFSQTVRIYVGPYLVWSDIPYLT